MGLETFALINEQGQVVNHIVVDKEADDFEEIMSGQLENWACTRYVETTEDKPVIILDEDPAIWTTHCADPACENQGFTLPEGYNAVQVVEVVVEPAPQSLNPEDYDHDFVVIKGKVYPADSKLIKENAASRPVGWVLPEGAKEVSLADAD